MMPSNPITTNTHGTRISPRLSVNLRRSSSGLPDNSSDRVVEIPGKIGVEGLKPTNFATERCWLRGGKCCGNYGVGNGRDWFDRSNENPGERFGQTIVGNDLPFFQRNQSSVSDDNMREQNFASRVDVQFPPGFLNQPTNGSSTEDFRSVIDDLTVENKRLKDRLRKYEPSSRIQPEKDKLFEVKVHGLSPRQKRQLEETLRIFVSTIATNDSKAGYHSLSPSKGGRTKYGSTVPKLTNGSSPATSDSRRVDSGYASLATPGPNSLSVFNHIGKDVFAHPKTTIIEAQEVQTFLNDIPQGLLPQEPANIPERTKKKLVVRRLEQLFTGESAFSRSDCNQALQQQEVSNLAALYDNHTADCKGTEGLREAHILESETELDKMESHKMHRISSHESMDDKIESGSDSSSKQRPTRPLDLDPDRTQVPSENMEYIRHLGLSAPDLFTTNTTDVAADADADGWVYLNLLVNMAQLHTINVTLGFIRSAVSEVSTKFQLSPDGKKIRWRGGTEGTRFGSDIGAGVMQHGSPNDSDYLEESARKRLRIGDGTRKAMALEQGLRYGQFSVVPINARGNQRVQVSTKRAKISHYEPLFQHHGSAGHDEMAVDESDSPSEVGCGGCRYRTNRFSLGHRHGAIVFYSGAPFCVDFSADQDNIPTPLHVTDVGKDGFSNHSHDALGCHGKTSPPGSSQTISVSSLSFRPFYDYSICANLLGDDEISARREPKFLESASDNLEFSPEFATTELQQQVPLLDLDASGLGGSRPADHFVITVKTSRPTVDSMMRTQMSRILAKGITTHKFLHTTSPSFLKTFNSREEVLTHQLSATKADSSSVFTASNGDDLPVKARHISTQYHRLKPSALPLPTNFYSEYSSSNDPVDEAASDTDTDSAITDHIQGSVASACDDDTMGEVCGNANDSNEDDDDEATNDDSSIDMLAQAREMDPTTVTTLEW